MLKSAEGKIPRIGLTPHPVTPRMNWGESSQGYAYVQDPGWLKRLFGEIPIFEREATLDSQTPPPYGAQLISIPEGSETIMWQRCTNNEIPEKAVDHLTSIEREGNILPLIEKIPVRTVVVYVRER